MACAPKVHAALVSVVHRHDAIPDPAQGENVTAVHHGPEAPGPARRARIPGNPSRARKIRSGRGSSGTWLRWGARTRVESCLGLDVRWVHRHYGLLPGARLPVAWTCNGNPSGDIVLEVQPAPAPCGGTAHIDGEDVIVDVTDDDGVIQVRRYRPTGDPGTLTTPVDAGPPRRMRLADRARPVRHSMLNGRARSRDHSRTRSRGAVACSSSR